MRASEEEREWALGFVQRRRGALIHRGDSLDDQHGDIHGHGGVDVRHDVPLLPPLYMKEKASRWARPFTVAMGQSAQ